MNRDRFVQLAAIVIAIACLAGTVLLAPTIREQRRELQLTFNLEQGRGAPPKYVLTAAAMGSFRGLVVDVLWYRIEHLKRAGKLHEANTLAEWITTLQPRFAQVWAFHAWNLAYNISVMTHTPEERWMWVSKGINLLRDEGIVYNPTVIRLYRELGWIFFHKVGQTTDDHHWYYKQQMAQKWQELLGAQTEGATTDEVLAGFNPIAEAADRYIRLDEPSNDTLSRLDELIADNADYEAPLKKLRELKLDRFIDKLPQTQQALREEEQFSLAEALDPMLESATQRYERSRRDPVELLKEDAPEAKRAVETWQDLGLEMNEGSLRDYGRMKMLARYVSVDRLLEQRPPSFTDRHVQVLRFMQEHNDQEALKPLLAFLRAKVLIQNYNMKPQYMLTLMERFGPMDWRHPASHAVYWSALGVKMSGQIRDSTKYDILNTDRQIVHGIQSLMHTGRISYDPITKQIDLLPDPRFIPKYDDAMDAALARATDDSVDFAGPGNKSAFQSGHQNFLHTATTYAYLYGSEEDAQEYYDKARRLYSDMPHNQRSQRYNQTLEEFVLGEMRFDENMGGFNRRFIEAMISRGLSQGLANGRPEVFNRFLSLARQMHEQYSKNRRGSTANAQRERLALMPFDEFLTLIYTNFMRSPGIDLFRRSRVYANTPAALRKRAFPQFRAAVYQQAQQRGINPEAAFPPPADADQEPLELREAAEDPPGTVERQ